MKKTSKIVEAEPVQEKKKKVIKDEKAKKAAVEQKVENK